MARIFRSAFKAGAVISLFATALCALSYRATAQWDLGAMLATKTDWIVHQCYLAETPSLKAVTFMAVGDYKLFHFIIQDNEMMTSSYDFDHKEGIWSVAGEQAFGKGDEIKKEIHRLNFRIVTSRKFNEMIKTQPKEACKD